MSRFAGQTNHTYCCLNGGASAISIGLSNVADQISKAKSDYSYAYTEPQIFSSNTGDPQKIFRNMWDGKPYTYSNITRIRNLDEIKVPP